MARISLNVHVSVDCLAKGWWCASGRHRLACSQGKRVISVVQYAILMQVGCIIVISSKVCLHVGPYCRCDTSVLRRHMCSISCERYALSDWPPLPSQAKLLPPRTGDEGKKVVRKLVISEHMFYLGLEDIGTECSKKAWKSHLSRARSC